MLLSAIGSTPGGSLYLGGEGSLLGSSSGLVGGGSLGDSDNPDSQTERIKQLEREVSALTNENLKLKEHS